MRICISSRYCSLKEDLNNRCIWYTLQCDHHRQENLWEQRSLNVEPTPHWKLSSFQIRNPKPLIHINDIYAVHNKYIIYMFFITLYLLPIGSYPLSRSRRVATPSPTRRGRSSAQGPGAFLKQGRNYLPRTSLIDWTFRGLTPVKSQLKVW